MSDAAREAEIAKYRRTYADDRKAYVMNKLRLMDALGYIRPLRARTSSSLLDVGCGRGALLAEAKAMGFKVRGVETVESLLNDDVEFGMAHELPFPNNAFDVVICTDVIEHILPGDDKLAVEEMCRVASKHVVISANNGPSLNGYGENLHINVRSFGEWESLFKKWSPAGARVRYLGAPSQQAQVKHGKFKAWQVSPAWRIDL